MAASDVPNLADLALKIVRAKPKRKSRKAAGTDGGHTSDVMQQGQHRFGLELDADRSYVALRFYGRWCGADRPGFLLASQLAKAAAVAARGELKGTIEKVVIDSMVRVVVVASRNRLYVHGVGS